MQEEPAEYEGAGRVAAPGMRARKYRAWEVVFVGDPGLLYYSPLPSFQMLSDKKSFACAAVAVG